MSLYEELEKYSKEDYCPMHMPGHKRNVEFLGNKLPYNIDITEINGFDDLHNPKGLIKMIEDKAKKLYESKRSFALINGSTCGILAGIRAVVKPHDKILVSRNCHKSVYHAIELNFLKSIYLMPNINEYGIEEKINPSEVQKQIENNKDIKLVVITSPTYEGFISNIKEIVKIAHKYNIPVLVDEAHGAHLKFIKEMKKYEALEAGADIVIQSVHKTLPALTQTAIMHIQGELVEEKSIENQLAIFETSSPSYILMSSIEQALDIVQKDGAKIFENYKKTLDKFYIKAKSLEKLRVLGNFVNNNYDKGKIVVITENTNITGNELAKILRKEYKIEVEMSGVNHIIAMTSICDSQENFERLITALKEIDKQLTLCQKKNTNYLMKIPNQKMLINDAINSSNTQFVNYKEAIGKVSKEYIWVYPPGIPIVTPGEIIEEQVICKIEEFLASKIEIRTSTGKFPKLQICF